MRINWSCSFAKDFVSVAEGATHLCSCPLLNMWSSCYWSYWLCCCCNLHKCWRLWFHAFVLLLQEEDCGFDLFEICGSLTVSPLTLRRWCCTFSKTNSRNLTNIWNNNQFSSISEISKWHVADVLQANKLCDSFVELMLMQNFSYIVKPVKRHYQQYFWQNSSQHI